MKWLALAADFDVTINGGVGKGRTGGVMTILEQGES